MRWKMIFKPHYCLCSSTVLKKKYRENPRRHQLPLTLLLFTFWPQLCDSNRRFPPPARQFTTYKHIIWSFGVYTVLSSPALSRVYMFFPQLKLTLKLKKRTYAPLDDYSHNKHLHSNDGFEMTSHPRLILPKARTAVLLGGCDYSVLTDAMSQICQPHALIRTTFLSAQTMCSTAMKVLKKKIKKKNKKEYTATVVTHISFSRSYCGQTC